MWSCRHWECGASAGSYNRYLVVFRSWYLSLRRTVWFSPFQSCIVPTEIFAIFHIFPLVRPISVLCWQIRIAAEMASQVESPVSRTPDTKEEEGLEKSYVEKIDSGEAEYQIDPIIDKSLTRKFDMHIVPWLFGLWILAFVDRSQ